MQRNSIHEFDKAEPGGAEERFYFLYNNTERKKKPSLEYLFMVVNGRGTTLDMVFVGAYSQSAPATYNGDRFVFDAKGRIDVVKLKMSNNGIRTWAKLQFCKALAEHDESL